MKTLIRCSLLTATVGTSLAFANVSEDSRQVQAIRSTESIAIDGVLSEAIWQNGHSISSFKQRDPNEGEAATERTVVRVAYDDDALYIGARMYDSSPDSIIARLGRRDSGIESDAFWVYLDPYHDKRSGYFFAINAAGTIEDGVIYNDDWFDDSWDGVWSSAANIDDEGWCAEMRIPYSQIRFHQDESHVWGINCARDITRKREESYLVYRPKKESGFVSRFLDLVGMKGITPARQIELLPYFRTKAAYTQHDADDPFNDGSEHVPRVGGDVKIGLSSNLTLDGTVNPDFGQVEVDPAVVNLGDVETFFSEKRPFFIEGSSTFNFGQGGASSFWGFNWSNPNFFYSRRIGRSPQGRLPGHDFADMPEGAHILGAGKLTGKLAGNWNVGTLHAVTGRETAELSLGGDHFRSEVEPLTYHTVTRGQKEIASGRHGIGFIGTGVGRAFDDDRLRDDINSHAITGGLDGWTFLDKDKTWALAGWTGMSHVRGSESRMFDLQRSSRHYLQRPDASHVTLDPDATSMTGFAGRLWAIKQRGNWIMNSAVGFIDPKFDVNDIGFMWRGDAINAHFGGGYKWTEPGRVFRYAQLIGSAFYTSDFGGNRIASGLWQSGHFQFKNYVTFEYDWAYNPENFSNSLTRGGPLVRVPPGLQTGFWSGTDSRKPFVFSGGTWGYVRGHRNWDRGFWFQAKWKARPNVTFSINPEVYWERTFAQYIRTQGDPLATETFSNRYIFGELHYRQLSSSLRLNWTFTPRLSLQLYAQPLLSSGDYDNIKELAERRTYDFNRYGEGESEITLDGGTYAVDPDGEGAAAEFSFSDPNFNFRSLRGNAVLRWEYRPGSTIFLVWTQDRSDYERIGGFAVSESVDRLWEAKPDNIFLVKVAHYLTL